MTLSNSPHTKIVMLAFRAALNLISSRTLPVAAGGGGVPAGHVVPHVQGAILVVPPIARFDHKLAMFGHGPGRVQEATIAFPIFQRIIAGEFQGDVRVLFSLDKLSNGRHPFALEGKRVLFLVPIEGRAVQDPTIMR